MGWGMDKYKLSVISQEWLKIEVKLLLSRVAPDLIFSNPAKAGGGAGAECS